MNTLDTLDATDNSDETLLSVTNDLRAIEAFMIGKLEPTRLNAEVARQYLDLCGEGSGGTDVVARALTTSAMRQRAGTAADVVRKYVSTHPAREHVLAEEIQHLLVIDVDRIDRMLIMVEKAINVAKQDAAALESPEERDRLVRVTMAYDSLKKAHYNRGTDAASSVAPSGGGSSLVREGTGWLRALYPRYVPHRSAAVRVAHMVVGALAAANTAYVVQLFHVPLGLVAAFEKRTNRLRTAYNLDDIGDELAEGGILHKLLPAEVLANFKATESIDGARMASARELDAVHAVFTQRLRSRALFAAYAESDGKAYLVRKHGELVTKTPETRDKLDRDLQLLLRTVEWLKADDVAPQLCQHYVLDAYRAEASAGWVKQITKRPRPASLYLSGRASRWWGRRPAHLQ